jgi:hypothetical protein
MKYLLCAESGPFILFNNETKDIRIAITDRDSIRRVWLADEDVTIRLNDGTETPVKAGQIVLAFYKDGWHPVAVDCPQWAEYLRKERENVQKQKEEWAKGKKIVDTYCDACQPCDECNTCEASC